MTWTRSFLFDANLPCRAAPKTSIAVTSRVVGTTEVFYITDEGAVVHFKQDQGQRWIFQGQRAPAGSASTTGGIAGVSLSESHLMIFWVGPKGSISGSTWQNDEWPLVPDVSPEGSASPDSAIVAWSPSEEKVWLNWISPQGAVRGLLYSSGWTNYTLAPDGSACPSAGLVVFGLTPLPSRSTNEVTDEIVYELEQIASQAQLVAWVTPQEDIATAYKFPEIDEWGTHTITGANASTTGRTLAGVTGLAYQAHNAGTPGIFRYSLFWITKYGQIYTCSVTNALLVSLYRPGLYLDMPIPECNTLRRTGPVLLISPPSADPNSTLAVASRANGTLELFWHDVHSDKISCAVMWNEPGRNGVIALGKNIAGNTNDLRRPVTMAAFSPRDGELQLFGITSCGHVSAGPVAAPEFSSSFAPLCWDDRQEAFA